MNAQRALTTFAWIEHGPYGTGTTVYKPDGTFVAGEHRWIVNGPKTFKVWNPGGKFTATLQFNDDFTHYERINIGKGESWYAAERSSPIAPNIAETPPNPVSRSLAPQREPEPNLRGINSEFVKKLQGDVLAMKDAEVHGFKKDGKEGSLLFIENHPKFDAAINKLAADLGFAMDGKKGLKPDPKGTELVAKDGTINPGLLSQINREVTQLENYLTHVTPPIEPLTTPVPGEDAAFNDGKSGVKNIAAAPLVTDPVKNAADAMSKRIQEAVATNNLHLENPISPPATPLPVPKVAPLDHAKFEKALLSHTWSIVRVGTDNRSIEVRFRADGVAFARTPSGFVERGHWHYVDKGYCVHGDEIGFLVNCEIFFNEALTGLSCAEYRWKSYHEGVRLEEFNPAAGIGSPAIFRAPN